MAAVEVERLVVEVVDLLQFPVRANPYNIWELEVIGPQVPAELALCRSICLV